MCNKIGQYLWSYKGDVTIVRSTNNVLFNNITFLYFFAVLDLLVTAFGR